MDPIHCFLPVVSQSKTILGCCFNWGADPTVLAELAVALGCIVTFQMLVIMCGQPGIDMVQNDDFDVDDVRFENLSVVN